MSRYCFILFYVDNIVYVIFCNFISDDFSHTHTILLKCNTTNNNYNDNTYNDFIDLKSKYKQVVDVLTKFVNKISCKMIGQPGDNNIMVQVIGKIPISRPATTPLQSCTRHL